MKIIIRSNLAELVEGKAAMLDRWLRVFNKNARFSKAYEMEVWDGYVHFFDMETHTFPAGLAYLVKKRCERRSIPLKIKHAPNTKGMLCEPVVPDFVMVEDADGARHAMRPHQAELVNRCLKKGKGGVEAATGSGKTMCIAAVTGSYLIQHDIRSLILVPKIGLLKQTAEELANFLGISVGCVGDGKRQFSEAITVATPQTLRFALPEKWEGNRLVRKHEPALRELIHDCDCLILDEAHHASSDTWFQLSLMSKARHRFAFSGTLKKGKRWEDLRLTGIVGRTIYRVKSKHLWRSGILAKPVVYFVTDESIYGEGTRTHKYQTAVNKGLVNDRRYNRAIARIAQHLVKVGKPPLILAQRIPHIRAIAKNLERLGVPHETLHGAHSTGQRSAVKDDFTSGEHFAIIASTIWDEGEDIPNIASLILAGGGRTHVALKQRLGRGMRRKADNRLSVFDFTHSHCRLLAQHAESRLNTYVEEGIEVRDLDSINRLSHFDF